MYYVHVIEIVHQINYIGYIFFVYSVVKICICILCIKLSLNDITSDGNHDPLTGLLTQEFTAEEDMYMYAWNQKMYKMPNWNWTSALIRQNKIFRNYILFELYIVSKNYVFSYRSLCTEYTLYDLMVKRFESSVATPGARQFCAMMPSFNSEIQMTSSPWPLLQFQLGMYRRYVCTEEKKTHTHIYNYICIFIYIYSIYK